MRKRTSLVEADTQQWLQQQKNDVQLVFYYNFRFQAQGTRALYLMANSLIHFTDGCQPLLSKSGKPNINSSMMTLADNTTAVCPLVAGNLVCHSDKPQVHIRRHFSKGTEDTVFRDNF